MRRPIGFLTLLLLALFSLRSSDAALQFDLHVGYEGKIREASWFPIVCEIFNDGPSFNGVIEIWSGGAIRDQDYVREVPVELPTNTRKRIVVPMFATGGRFGSQQWNGKLSGGGRKPEERTVTVQTVSLESLVMGALPRNFGGSPVFPERKNRGRQDMDPQVGRFTVETFPDNPISLEGLGALYIHSEKAVDLRVPQITAILGWVRSGGHLIVAAEQVADLNGTPWLKQFLPIEITDQRNLQIGQAVFGWVRNQGVNAPPEQPRRGRRPAQPTGNTYADLSEDSGLKEAEMAVLTGTVRDGSILLAAENVPLIVQAPRGRGKVTVLAFSPEREPFRSWKERGLFWAKLAGIPGEFFNSPEQYGFMGASVDGIFGALIDSRQIKKLPVAWLLLLLVVYLVVIGPFDQWWLKKINRQMLTWITFPAYVVLFSLLIYFIGYKLRAGVTEWNELNIVDVLPRGEQVDLRGRTYISVYSSKNDTYPIVGQQGYATLRGELMGYQSMNREASKARVQQQGNSFKAQVDVAVWTSSLYANDWFRTNDTPFVASVSETGTGYLVEVENLLDIPLNEIRVVAGQMIFELEPLAAGEKRSVELQPGNGKAIHAFVHENGQYFARAANNRQSVVGETAGGQLENRPLTATVASFISYLEAQQYQRSFVAPPGLDLAPQVERGDAVIFAWLPGHTFGGKINGFKPPRFRQDTLLRLTVPVRPRTI